MIAVAPLPSSQYVTNIFLVVKRANDQIHIYVDDI